MAKTTTTTGRAATRRRNDDRVVQTLSVNPQHCDREGYEWVRRKAWAGSHHFDCDNTFLLHVAQQYDDAPASVLAIVAAAMERDCIWIVVDPEEDEVIEGVRTYSYQEYMGGKNHDA